MTESRNFQRKNGQVPTTDAGDTAFRDQTVDAEASGRVCGVPQARGLAVAKERASYSTLGG